MHNADCSCCAVQVPMQETLEEMDWDRGVWKPSHTGNLQGVKKFIEADARWLDAFDSCGYVPLHYAASKGHSHVVAYLLQRGAVPDPMTPSGRTPLHKAAVKGHIETVTLLLQNSANPLHKDGEGTTPTDEAPTPLLPLLASFSTKNVALPTYQLPRVRKDGPHPTGSGTQCGTGTDGEAPRGARNAGGGREEVRKTRSIFTLKR
eukprot:TRINITY_DN5473_c0_g1_i1.p1 TRINITY_DN5473_c0_g1~~TRINITY_DN5473_c0_g1_i1.p1  ORF type:complete len:219 (+),score=27.84 TRINITY_DN5473_c0_g1_i1:43-657(+)